MINENNNETKRALYDRYDAAEPQKPQVPTNFKYRYDGICSFTDTDWDFAFHGSKITWCNIKVIIIDMLKSNGPVPMDNVQESPMSHNVNDLTVTDRDTEGTTSGMDDCDESTLQNQQSRMIGEIEALVKQQPLTSDKFLLSCLQEQYKNNTNFISGLTQLHETYRHIRIIRGDGNCYYRAFLYSLLEQHACERGNDRRE